VVGSVKCVWRMRVPKPVHTRIIRAQERNDAILVIVGDVSDNRGGLEALI
jgi:hypothetical protein